MKVVLLFLLLMLKPQLAILIKNLITKYSCTVTWTSNLMAMAGTHIRVIQLLKMIDFMAEGALMMDMHSLQQFWL